MTARVIPQIVCDDQASPSCWSAPGTPVAPSTIAVQGTHYAAIRARLREEGWTRPHGFLDRCPACGKVDAPALRAEGGRR